MSASLAPPPLSVCVWLDTLDLTRKAEPGGYLQWDELDWAGRRIVRAFLHCLRKMYRSFLIMCPNGRMLLGRSRKKPTGLNKTGQASSVLIDIRTDGSPISPRYTTAKV